MFRIFYPGISIFSAIYFFLFLLSFLVTASLESPPSPFILPRSSLFLFLLVFLPLSLSSSLFFF